MFLYKVTKFVKFMTTENNIKKLIPVLVRESRKQKHLTQKELAQKIGICARQIGKIEDGTYLPNLITYFKLCEVLEINLDKVKLWGEYSLRKDEVVILELIKTLSEDNLKTCLKILKAL